MYLKELEIKGFKSFADYTKLTFSTEISAIVGPNGSGKSNIIDAIRWVLGEQSSKSLRSRRMNDVIFSGADNRSAMGFSEVNLLLGRDKSDKGDLLITRRLFKDGESEYKINQKKVKLKDILSLFMDTGVGKNGYSIISQGGIDSIVNASPSDLREIVEEAVGIVTYKSKKIEAEKRLIKANDNLERINDIRIEVERQYKPLKRQAEKARMYLDLREKLKTADLFYYHQEIQKIDEDVRTVKNDLKDIETQVYNYKIEYETQDKEYLNIKAQIKELESKREQQGDAQEDCLKRLTQSQDQISVLEKEKNIEENNLVHGEKLLSQLSEEKNNLLPLLEKNAQEKEENLLKRSQYCHEEKTLQRAREEKQRHLDQLRHNQLDLQQKFNNEQQIIQNLGTQVIQKQEELKHVLDDLTQIDQANNNIFEKIVSQAEAYKAWHQNFRQIYQELQKNRLELTSIVNQRQHREEALKKQNDRMSALENQTQVLQSKLQYLISLQENYKDYFFAVQKIMSSQKDASLKNAVLYGPLSDLITTEIQYSKAINAVMGARSNHIVVEDLQSTRACIELLKEKKWGRVTFLPLSNIQAYVIDHSILKKCQTYQGFIGLAKDLIQGDALFLPVIEMVFGRALIVHGFQNAQNLFNGIHKKHMVVTTEGEIFYPNGSIVGGESKRNMDTPFMRRQETKALQKKKAELNKKKQNLKVEIDESQEQYTWYAQKSALQEKAIQHIRQNHLKMVKVLQNLSYEVETKSALYLENIDKAQALSKAQISENRTLDLLKNQLKRHENERPKPEAIDQEIDQKTNAIQAIENNLQEKQLEILRIDKELAITTERLSHHENRLSHIENQCDIARKELKLAQNKQATCMDALQKLKEKHTELEELNLGLAASQRQTIEKINTLKAASEKTETAIKEKNRAILNLTETESALKLQVNNLENKLHNIEEEAYKNYGYNLTMIEDHHREHKSAPMISKTEQEKLRRSIDKLGNINVNAIEEFKDLDERYQFISTQYDDLTASRESVLEIINELNTSIEAQFAEKFEILQTIFKRTFKTLFEGGYAEINYETPEDVLNSGVHIIARPPGKNLTHLNLLSGGEKSMLAISLLFSFIELNPSPFCIIDEIDASLDDNNIDRFTDYLLHFSQETQFLLITHRRNTVEVCKKIYGVSMAQNGISQVISLDLEEYMKSRGEEDGIAI
ncbi:MAG: chromosome segregation protein SMC [Eubacteriaceae bacterium]|nr:chromosome segregation protein SMC [Eubacteriaceae bacterium]